jgi:hypothetical protein
VKKKIIILILLLGIGSIVIYFKRGEKKELVDTGPLCMPEQDESIVRKKNVIKIKYDGYVLEQLSTSARYVKIVTKEGSCLYVKRNKMGTAPCADPEFNSDFLFDSQSGVIKDPISLECVELSKKKPYLRKCD